MDPLFPYAKGSHLIPLQYLLQIKTKATYMIDLLHSPQLHCADLGRLLHKLAHPWCHMEVANQLAWGSLALSLSTTNWLPKTLHGHGYLPKAEQRAFSSQHKRCCSMVCYCMYMAKEILISVCLPLCPPH